MNGDPIAQASRDPVSDSGPILRHRWGPSSRVPLPDSWRVLKTRKDSDSHPPPLPGGGLPVCTGPSSEIRIGKAEREKREKDRRPNASFAVPTSSRAKAIHNL